MPLKKLMHICLNCENKYYLLIFMMNFQMKCKVFMLIKKRCVTDISLHDAKTLSFDSFLVHRGLEHLGKKESGHLHSSVSSLLNHKMGISIITKLLNIERSHCDINEYSVFTVLRSPCILICLFTLKMLIYIV